ncbi:MAG: alpha/beta fold hydrolase [Solirubrobacterales bacterium]|nr:alpha/beta fold hydrolase [Solirubrobacterales bacterium]
MRRLLIAVLAVLAVLAALIVVNAVVVGGESKPARAAEGGRVLELPAGDLNVRDVGPRDAPAIVLVHCYTCSLRYWQELEPLLARDRRVISVDLLGHGDSEKPADADAYSMEHQADAVAEALDALDAPPALAVGQSLGGPVVTALAERHPERVRGLVVMDSAASRDSVDLPLTARLARAPVIGPLLKRVAPDGVVREELSKAFAEGYEVPDEFVADVQGMTFTSFAESAKAGNRYGDEGTLDERIAATGLPLTVIFGAEDRIVDPADAEAFRDVPGARVVVIPAIGHTPQLEAPARSARLVRQLDRQTLPATDNAPASS